MPQGRPTARSRFLPGLPTLAWPAIVVVIVVGLLVVWAIEPDRRLTVSPDQRLIIEKIRSVLMHDADDPQYGRVVDQADGRGYVAGTGDFSTAGGEIVEVLDTYTARVGANPLSLAYLPVLKRLADRRSPAVGELAGLPEAWRLASKDPRFRQAQDDVLDDRYYQPAMRISTDLGLTTPLGLAIIYDTLLQHGDSADPDALPSIIYRTEVRADGRPRKVPEHDWLSTFLAERRATLTNPSNERRRATWPYTVGRVDALGKLLADRADDLRPPLTLSPYGRRHVLDLTPSMPTVADSTTHPPATPSPSPSPSAVPRSASPPAALPSPRSAGSRRPSATTSPAPASSRRPAAPTATAPRDGLLVRVVATGGKSIGVADGASFAGAKIVLSGGTGPAERWRVIASTSGCFHLVNVRSGMALDNPDGTWTNGVQMRQWEYGWGTSNQSWCFTPVGGGRYSIRNLTNYYLLDVRDGGTSDGTAVQQWGADAAAPNANQTWRLVPAG
ncbi:chitosanase [Micromonospora sp. NPDC018662]|uniref:chitosanase n=1 Tax=Micromonospora sp. NPDC018662 TaxID=3364238 RepID=UPI00378BB9C0